MASWLASLVLASIVAVCSATSYATNYGGYYHDSRPHGDHDPRVGPGMSVSAHFEMAGIRGEICFNQAEPGANVTITVKLTGLEQYEPQEFDWSIHEFPVEFTEYPDFPCEYGDDQGRGRVGGIYGDPVLCDGPPQNVIEPGCVGNVGFRHSPLKATSEPQVFSDGVLSLFGPDSPIGRSIVIRSTLRVPPIACANIEYQGVKLHTYRAALSDQLSGDVILRRQNGRSGTTLRAEFTQSCDTTVRQIVDQPPPQLLWYLRSGTCDRIGPVYGNDTHTDEIHHGAFRGCSRDNPRECPAGDLTTKCGALTPEVFDDVLRYRAFCHDDQLGLLSKSQLENTILVFHDAITLAVVECTTWSKINQLCARVNCIKRPRINMDVLFFQSDPNDRTHVRSYITGLDQEKAYLQVRQDPVTDTSMCEAGGIYDKPRNALLSNSHVGDKPTGDVLPVGVLEYKITSPRGRESVVKQDTTSWLPLFGPFSIIGRSLALTDENGVPVACCNIMPVEDPSPELINSVLGYQEQTNRPARK